MKKQSVEKFFQHLKDFCVKNDSDDLLESIEYLEDEYWNLRGRDGLNDDEGLSEVKSNSNPLSLDLPKELQEARELGHSGIGIYSDGGCRGNPGPGSFFTFAQNQDGKVLYEAQGVEMNTTNNRMELMGAISGLKRLLEYWKENHGGDLRETMVYFYCDSNYVVQGLNDWRHSWKKNQWRRKTGKIENLDLWQQLDELAEQVPEFQAIWVKGHAGNGQNEYCDRMCNQLMDELLGK